MFPTSGRYNFEERYCGLYRVSEIIIGHKKQYMLFGSNSRAIIQLLTVDKMTSEYQKSEALKFLAVHFMDESYQALVVGQ